MPSKPLSPAARATALEALAQFPALDLGHYPTEVESLDRFRKAAGLPQRILVKRDDAITFAFGGNKVRKLRYLIPTVLAAGADTVVSCGDLQSNHARATAAAATVSGLACHLIVNAAAPREATANALLNRLLGATFEYVEGRDQRRPAMERAVARFAAAGRKAEIVPLGASTPHGALGYLAAIGELLAQGIRPDVIVHSSSSGGTSAGLLAGCAIQGLSTRVIGVSADDPPAQVEAQVRAIIAGLESLLRLEAGTLDQAIEVEVDDGWVGAGYGEPTEASIEAQSLAATAEGIFVDHTYTAKGLAALIGYCRDGRIRADATVLFWHTGGQVALFA